MKKVIAICTSDWHLQHTAPLARSNEPNWYTAMTRPINEIVELACLHDCPILIAGDIFDRWNSPPELINFAQRLLTRVSVYAVPGQHDLPNHRYADIKRSAYWTLVGSKTIFNLEPQIPYRHRSLVLHGFPWSYPVTKLKDYPDDQYINIALVHNMIWKGNPPYPGASRSDELQRYTPILNTYNLSVFGDNHNSFFHSFRSKSHVFNCGSLMRRNIDQIDYQPQVGLLYSDCSFKIHLLDTSQDKMLNRETLSELSKATPELVEVIQQFARLSTQTSDFLETLKKLIMKRTISIEVRTVLEEIIERIKNDR